MNIAFTMQKFQDWLTQQWVIFCGRKINPIEYNWLIGPFGELNGIGEKFIYQLAEKENLIIKRNSKRIGLLKSIDKLCLTENELNNLSEKIIDFYTHTSDYNLSISVKWNPFFKFFGILVNQLFSRRINQLNIPTNNIKDSENISSEIIELIDNKTKKVKYTIWLRKFKITGKVIYSGIYGTCKLPSGLTCIKAIFPLPKGNATVIMKPTVGKNNQLILNSSGKTFGDAGFYFLLNDSKNNYWSQFISTFKDKLIISEENDLLQAKQTLFIWGVKVVVFNYVIEKRF